MMEPPTPVPSLSPAEMQILVSRTGLVLNPGQVADLVLAWRQVAMLIGSIPRDRPLADDLAVSFRLPPPPAPMGQPSPGGMPGDTPAPKATGQGAAKAAAKPAPAPKPTQAKGKPAAPKRATRAR